jgi:hypothetical protein
MLKFSICLFACLFCLTSPVPDIMAQDLQSQKQAAPESRLLEPRYDTFVQAAQKQLDESTATVKLVGNVEEKNLAIEWNDWHNRFSRAVRKGAFASIYEMLNFRPGTITYYRCEVTADRHIKDVRIVRSSGNFWFDGAVVKAVRNLDGDDILAFPAGSRRSIISTEVGVQFGGGRKGDLNFGDVEYREATPEELRKAAETEKQKNEARQDKQADKIKKRHKRESGERL